MKISRKLSIGILAVLLVVCSGALYSHYRLMITGEKERLESLGSTVGRVIEESLAYAMLGRDADLLRKTLDNLQHVEPISRILLLNNENIVMAGTDSEAAGKRLEFTGARKPFNVDGGTVFPEEKTYRWVQGVRNRSECHACHSPAAGYNGAIIIDFSTVKAEGSIRQHVMKESLIFLCAFALAGYAAYFLSNMIVIKRLGRVIDHMRRFKEGDESVRIHLAGNDEITRLSEGFNEMADAVSHSQTEQKKYADELLALAVSCHVVTAVPRTENLSEAVCNLAVRELKLAMASIGLVRKGSPEVQPAGQSALEQGPAWNDFRPGTSPAGAVARKKAPQVINDISTEPGYLSWRDEAMKRGCRSSMAVPLLSSSGELFGVLNLYSGQPGYFTRKRVRMFMIYANQAATEIENRTLVENVEKSKIELTRQVSMISRSQREWQMTFDSITDLVTIHDRDFRIIKANRAVAEYFGLTPREIVNRKCHEIFHESCSVPANCPHGISLKNKRAATEEVRDPRTGKLFRVSTFPYYSEQGEFIGSVHVARDITREKETETRLIMSERLAALGQMASGLAHEINTPLASIAGCAEGLLMKVKNGRYDSQVFEEYLQVVEEEIQRCKSITTGMLSFVRRSTYEKKDVRINEALDRTLEIVGFQGRLKDVAIVRRYDEELPVIHGSEGELRQVFLAMIVNALDAMEDAGTLTFETGRGKESVFIRISDSGPGIAAEDMNRIFDPFYTTKSENGGTGLGLSIAYKIIANHNGTIDVSSEEGSGAVFSITLPLPALTSFLTLTDAELSMKRHDY